MIFWLTLGVNNSKENEGFNMHAHPFFSYAFHRNKKKGEKNFVYVYYGQ